MAEPVKQKPNLVLGVRFKERKDDPPPGLTWRRVHNRESLGTIADEFGIRAVDLALINWHTARPAEINWYIYNFVGSRKNNGKWYMFSESDKPGMILVPDIPDALKKNPPKSINAVRNGPAKLNTKLQVRVVERLANMSLQEVTGKWLYVFSGGGGVDFGYSPPPPLPTKVGGLEFPASEAEQPGTAFTLDFPGIFPIKERPDKLEYEIMITPEEPPSYDVVVAASGKKSAPPARYKYNSSWHFVSDPTVLKKATSDGRDTRTSHAFRNTKLVTIDLEPKGKPRRYYFLLSPFQLGPEALKYAMSHPEALTPLLKPGHDADAWDPDKAGGVFPDMNKYLGPTPEDVKKGSMTLAVIDPYAWAENLAEEVWADAVRQYVEWTTSRHNATIEELKHDTGWSFDHYYLAKLLRQVRDSHSDPDEIDDEIKELAKWEKNLKEWETRLVQRNAEITASGHRELLRLLEWLDGPAHKVIETTLLKDTTADDRNGKDSQDAIDIARGILHWAVCTEHMMVLEPGVFYLRDIFSKPGSIPHDVVLQHFKDLEKDTLSVTLSHTDEIAFRYAYQGVLMLLALQEFVRGEPPIDKNLPRDDYLMKLADYSKRRRDNLVKVLNTFKVLPAQVKGLDKLPDPPSKGSAWPVVSTTLNSFLDVADKWTTYVIDPDIQIPRNKGRILLSLSDMELWFQKRPTFAKIANMGTSYTLKVAALGVSSYNLYASITTARYDYQRSVSANDWMGVASGATLAVQDALAEMAVLLGSKSLQRVFPQLMTTAGGPAWGVGAAPITGVAGRIFAGVNVFAMLISGVVTIVSNVQGFTQAKARSDYTAAAFYGLGVVGGGFMVAGAIVFGVALMKVGAGATATGVGATVGVILFFIGGVIAAIAAIGAWLFTSDDFEVFARKCFLGKDGADEPRFDGSPPDWSLASTKGPDSWPLEKQTQALFNLLGRFQLKTEPSKEFKRNVAYRDSLYFEIKPGLVMPGSTVEVALHHGAKGSQTSATMRWDEYQFGGKQKYSDKPVATTPGSLFKVDDTFAQFTYKGDSELKQIRVTAFHLDYDGDKGSLVATVTLSYPDRPNKIRARKLVMEHGTIYGVTVDSDEVTSELFE